MSQHEEKNWYPNVEKRKTDFVLLRRCPCVPSLEQTHTHTHKLFSCLRWNCHSYDEYFCIICVVICVRVNICDSGVFRGFNDMTRFCFSVKRRRWWWWFCHIPDRLEHKIMLYLDFGYPLNRHHYERVLNIHINKDSDWFFWLLSCLSLPHPELLSVTRLLATTSHLSHPHQFPSTEVYICCWLLFIFALVGRISTNVPYA